MRVNYYQDFHEEKRSGESNDEIRVNVDDGAEVGAFIHVANVTNFNLVKKTKKKFPFLRLIYWTKCGLKFVVTDKFIVQIF